MEGICDDSIFFYFFNRVYSEIYVVVLTFACAKDTTLAKIRQTPSTPERPCRSLGNIIAVAAVAPPNTRLTENSHFVNTHETAKRELRKLGGNFRWID